MSKVIYAIYVNTGAVGACLDAIRLLASPATKRLSHVTVRGPYDHPMSDTERANLEKKLKPNSIVICGSGNFFREGQNTVFFRCDGNQIGEIWDKRGYGFVPHVTVYDGPDRNFAQSVYDTMHKFEYNVKCGADKLIQMEIGNGTNGALADRIKLGDIPEGLQLPPQFNRTVSDMSAADRLRYIRSICEYLSSYR